MANGKVTWEGVNRVIEAIEADELRDDMEALAAKSDEEIRRELEEMGIDVPAFEKRLRARIEQAIAEGKALPDGALKEG